MGTRIAVLNGGIIQQIGTPQYVYDHPSNLFVAGFIGSPSMNFLEDTQVVSEENGIWLAPKGAGHIEVPPQYQEQAQAAANKKLTLGIRPEHLEDVTLLSSHSESRSTLEASVEVIEYLGSELLVYLTLAGKTMIARLDPRSGAHVGDKITLSVDRDQIHLFDTQTGEAIF